MDCRYLLASVLLFFSRYILLMMRLSIVLLFCVIGCCRLIGQQDSLQEVSAAVTLSGVTLYAPYQKVSPLDAAVSWSATEVARTSSINLSDLLQQSSSIHVKSYGSGGLATISVRGTGAGRSATVWNGMPLIGSTLGLLDYSLLNANLFEQVRLDVGGDAGRYGSGSIGGNVLLDNREESLLEEGSVITLKTVLGSFERVQQGLRYNLRKGKWWATTRAVFETAQEDFTYRIREDLPEKTNTNAARKQLSLLQSLGYRINTKNEIALHLWAQDNTREIPPTTVQNRSEAEVLDKTLRAQAIWKSELNESLDVKTIAAFSYNQNLFNDSLNLVFGDNAFTQTYFKSEVSRGLKNGVWHAGISNRHTQARTENYTVGQSQNQLAFFFDYSSNWRGLDIYASVREELLNASLNPLSGKIALGYSFGPRWSVEASVNKHFRTPALNDLYWAPGGDAALQAEQGWSQELTLKYEKTEQWNTGLNVYNHHIKNWIQWGLLDGENFFSALNLPEVWSRGIEGFVNWNQSLGEHQWGTQLSYNYNLATYEFDLRSPSIAFGEQAYYTPVHQAVANVKYAYRNFSINYMHRYQSGVSTILDPLDGFHLGSCSVRYQMQNVNVFLDINNIWDTNYRVIERRPMPGRNFAIGVNFKLVNTKKENGYK